MKLRKKYLPLLTVFAAIVLNMTVPFVSGERTYLAQTNSVPSSVHSATPVDDRSQKPEAGSQKDQDQNDEALRRACGEAVEELRAARKLIASQDELAGRSGELLALERQISQGLRDLRTLDAAEKDQLKQALAAKDRAITAVEAENAVLKKKRETLWKKVKWIAIGALAGAAVCGIVCRQ